MNEQILADYAQQLLGIDSPTGFTQHAIAWIEEQVQALGYTCYRNAKGNLIVEIEGLADQPVVAVSAHTDTLGLMVRAIKKDGKLAFTRLGGPCLPTLDGEYCRIITRQGKVYTGTILSTAPAVHVYKEASSQERSEETMEVRIDELVRNEEDVRQLGIQAGDIIAIDPKTTITPSGFIKSRFLDDKISAAIFLTLLKALKDENVTLPQKTYFLFSTYEEVGHGASWIPGDVTELLAVDMGCIGTDLSCTETDVSICAKDSGGPYDYQMTSRLIELAQAHQLPYAVDIYPFYGSDCGAALKGGNDIRGALIGPGVHASHGMERTHMQGVSAAYTLLAAYLIEK
ncbi:M42 family metallopeptidase [Holdemania filiformis]|uniref:Aminopeptidase n=1 Tax=Holdemania filiformis TaxID=61171 RepID=A0A412G5X0_9FIRM|nr:M42 family metallopeptidase [Holdemania filiformis]MBS5002057.1 M42 family metallopeptidase [Holdemania filiformis]RGR76406.1 aminopeptidase [Holdemania filiformis]